MYKNNNTGQWLEEKSDIEQQHIINDAVAKFKQFNINVKENKKYLYDQRVIHIKEMERLKKEREGKKKKINEKIPKDLEDIGIWNNIETIENNLAKMKTKKEKTTALKHQINMCRKMVQVPSKDKYIFLFSKKGKQFDIQQLKKKLLKLIEKSNVDNNQLDHTDQLIQFLKDNPRNVIGRHLEHEWSDKKWKSRVIALQDNEFEVNIRHLTVHITHCSGTLLQNLFCQHKHLSYNYLTV